MVAFLAEALSTTDADLPALLTGRIFLIDGTLVPTFNWRHRKDLLSGKRRKHGMNLQLFVDVHGGSSPAAGPFPAAGMTSTACARPGGWNWSSGSATPWEISDTKANPTP